MNVSRYQDRRTERRSCLARIFRKFLACLTLASLSLSSALAAQALVLRLWHRSLQTVDGQNTSDAKTALQEWAQARGLPPPTYLTKRRDGPDHAPVFEIEAQLSDGPSARAKAGTKRAAEQAAAQALLDTMEADT